MRKGEIHTCNGCYAFEEGAKLCAFGSPAASYTSEPFCSIGIDIIKIENKYGWKPKDGICGKPKNISDLVRLRKIFYETTKRNTKNL